MTTQCSLKLIGFDSTRVVLKKQSLVASLGSDKLLVGNAVDHIEESGTKNHPRDAVFVCFHMRVVYFLSKKKENKPVAPQNKPLTCLLVQKFKNKAV